MVTGGSTIDPDIDAFGIFTFGDGARVLNNDVIDTQAQGEGIAWGIYFSSGGSGGLAVNNRITNADRGIEFVGTTTGKYRDNLTFGVATPFSGGTSVGIND